MITELYFAIFRGNAQEYLWKMQFLLCIGLVETVHRFFPKLTGFPEVVLQEKQNQQRIK